MKNKHIKSTVGSKKGKKEKRCRSKAKLNRCPKTPNKARTNIYDSNTFRNAKRIEKTNPALSQQEPPEAFPEQRVSYIVVYLIVAARPVMRLKHGPGAIAVPTAPGATGATAGAHMLRIQSCTQKTQFDAVWGLFKMVLNI